MLTNPNWTIQYIHTARLLYWDQPLGVTIIQLSTAPWLPLCWVQAWNNIHIHLRRRKEGQDTFWEKKIILLNLFVHKLCNKYISSQRNHFLKASLFRYIHSQKWLDACTHSNHCTARYIVPCEDQLQHSYDWPLKCMCLEFRNISISANRSLAVKNKSTAPRTLYFKLKAWSVYVSRVTVNKMCQCQSNYTNSKKIM